MEDERRINPDDLLASLQESNKGKLTVFLGAAAGVGKTYAMLETARERKAEGIDLVAGWVEPHARAETMALMEGIPTVAPRNFDYRGKVLKEMDLDAILARHPNLVLVDELAHTNVPGSRHLRRYQDVEELLASGVNVYTTLNIQHVESFNDIVAQITGVKVRETVPDYILEKAHIQLIDITPEELIQRFQEGKVYVSQQAERALKNFFRPGNINALREMSMRFTAQRVDRQLENYMRDHNITGPWPASERVMVCISSGPFSERLIRIGRRIAVGIKSELLVVYVETPQRFPVGEKERYQLAKNMHLAQELEAETISLSGDDIAEELLEIARKRNVTQIIIGKPGKSSLRERLTGSIVDKVIRHSPNISVHVIPGEIEKGKRKSEKKPSPGWWRRKFSTAAYVEPFLILLVVTIAGWLWGSYLGIVNMAMIYLLPVLFGAVKWGRKPAVTVAIASVLAYDFFFIPPQFTFTVYDLRYLISFLIILLVAIFTGKLSTRLRLQVENSRRREAQTAALYALSREIAAVSQLDVVLESVARKVSETVEGQVAVFLPDKKNNLEIRACYSTDQICFKDENERAVASWAFEHGRIVGRGTDTLGGASGCYLPLQTERGTSGVLGIRFYNPERYLKPEQKRLLEAFTNLIALAVSRISLVEQAREAQLLSESEKLHSALLNSVSHDLRTPLASMLGAVTSLLEEEEVFDAEARRDLLQTIKQGAMRMNRLVNNLLDMARLDSGMLRLNKEWCDIEDIVGVAVSRLKEPLKNRPIKIDIKNGLPLVQADFVLIEQVVVNLLDNALKYSQRGSGILLSVHKNNKELEVSVHDQGVAIPESDLERVFDKFYRIKAPRQISGTGLGLAICKGIIDVHGGRIWAENSPTGGVTITFVLPLDDNVPLEVPAAKRGEQDGK